MSFGFAEMLSAGSIVARILYDCTCMAPASPSVPVAGLCRARHQVPKGGRGQVNLRSLNEESSSERGREKEERGRVSE